MNKPDLPLTLAEITAERITPLLAEKYPGTQINSLHLGSEIHGSSTTVRLLLDYNAAGHRHGLPPTMWLKGGFEGHGLIDSIYPREVWFYQNLADELGSSLPKCYYAGSNDKQAIVLLEDLLARNVQFSSATNPATPEQAKILLTRQAQLHGSFWESPRLDTLCDQPSRESGSDTLDFLIQVLSQPENFNRCMGLPRAQHLPDELRDINLMHQALDRMLKLFDAAPKCLVHGDPHFGNTYFTVDGSDGGYIDWAGHAKGVGAFDVAYGLNAVLSIDDRRAHEKELLQHYLHELVKSGGPEIKFEDAWLHYRQFLYGALVWSVCPPEMQAEDIITVSTERACAAVQDLQTLQALGL